MISATSRGTCRGPPRDGADDGPQRVERGPRWLQKTPHALARTSGFPDRGPRHDACFELGVDKKAAVLPLMTRPPAGSALLSRRGAWTREVEGAVFRYRPVRMTERRPFERRLPARREPLAEASTTRGMSFSVADVNEAVRQLERRRLRTRAFAWVSVALVLFCAALAIQAW